MFNGKICSKCKKEKELSEFHKDKYTKDGHRFVCKRCVKEKDAFDYLNKGKREMYKEKYLQHKEDILKKNKKWRDANKEHIKLKNREYYNKRREYLRQYNSSRCKELMKNSSVNMDYSDLHKLIRKQKKKQNHCFICNERKKLQLACIGHFYTLNLKDYLYLCSECHNLFDKCYIKRGFYIVSK
jgi:hypothetical protein